MCFDFDARPPDLPAEYAPIAGGAAAETLELTSADGTRFSVALAESPTGSDPAVLILPDVRGLYRFYIELAERFADAGHHAIAMDYFGRTAGVGERGEDFEYMPHAQATTVEQIQADALAARETLIERTGARSVVTVGFCFGGTHSFLATTSAELNLSGAVAFYGGLSGERWGIRGPLARVAELRGPLLGLYGGADQGIPVEQVEQFERALSDAGTEEEIHVYAGAPHSFFDRTYDEHAEACADAWRRVLGFLSDVGARVAL
jgi:carboxymethylenebutenolidase